jgi:hypothetical protein
MTTPYTTPGPLAQQYRISRGQRSRAKGWRMPANGVCCSRPGRYGNPFPLAICHNNAGVACFEYSDWLSRHEIFEGAPVTEYLAPLVERWQQHRSLVLLCWCAPDAPCHCVPLADAVALELERQGVTP